MILRPTNRVLVECSEPGTVVAFEEDLENVLRHITFDKALSIRKQLAELAEELGEQTRAAWQPFRIETPNDQTHPLAFSTREEVEKQPLEQLIEKAHERGVGTFTFRSTLLLNQDAPLPESRDQFVEDLANAVESGDRDEASAHRYSTKMPESIVAWRRTTLTDAFDHFLQSAATSPSLGRSWIDESTRAVKNALDNACVRCDAVVEYELGRLEPTDLEATEISKWAALSVRMGRLLEKWCVPLFSTADFAYHKIAMVCMLWCECSGRGPARPFLEKEMKALLEESRSSYSVDGAAAVELVFKRLKHQFHSGLFVSPGCEPESKQTDTAD